MAMISRRTGLKGTSNAGHETVCLGDMLKPLRNCPFWVKQQLFISAISGISNVIEWVTAASSAAVPLQINIACYPLSRKSFCAAQNEANHGTHSVFFRQKAG